MTSQLRRYTINGGKLDEFVDAWRKGVYPLRLRFGFAIPHAWIIRERNEFIWIVNCEGSPDDFNAKEAVYYASADRAAVAADPRPLIARTEQWFIAPVLTTSPSA